MTAKPKKAKRRRARSRAGEVIELQASVEDDLLFLAEEGTPRRAGNRPRKRRISLRGYRSGRLVQVQRSGLPDANQPDEGRPHGGVIFVDEKTISPANLGALVRALSQIHREMRNVDWADRVVFLRR
jgi:hypothetical protein